MCCRKVSCRGLGRATSYLGVPQRLQVETVMDNIMWTALFTVLGALIGGAVLIARDMAREKRERDEQDQQE